MNRVPPKASQVDLPPRRCFPTVTVLGVAALVLIGAISWVRSRSSESHQPTAAPIESEAADNVPAPAAGETAVAPSALKTRPARDAAQISGNSASAVAGAGSAAAEQAIGQLAHLQIADGKLTAEQGQQIRRNLQQLVAQGAASLPAIRAFLEQNQDLPFGQDGSKVAGVPSLRAGLIESLRQIGGPESVALSHQVLQTSADPLEISLLTRNLEEAAPGQYRQEALDVSRQSLALAAQGKLGDRDLGPVFQVLQTYGDATTAADLVKLAPQWNYYATMALAGMPAGQGIASLIELAHQAPSAETGQYNKLPYQMLAQLSAQYPEASSALLDMVSQNQVPDSAWRAIAAGLGGNQYQFARQLPQNAFPSGATMEAGSSRIGGPSETFYSLPLAASASGSDVAQRMALIDQLLAANPNNPTAQAALQSARAKLSAPGTGR